MRVWKAQQEYIRRTEEFIRRNLAGTRAREARGRRTRLERFAEQQAVEKPKEHKQARVRFSPSARSGEMVLAARGLAVGYDPAQPLLTAEAIRLERGRRVAIVGANGVGKTTLLRTLLGELPALKGSVRRGANVAAGYLPQTQEALEAETTCLQAVLDAAGGSVTTEQARTLLGGMLFADEEVFKRIGELSGGQRTRLLLAGLAASGANLLVLDEPTNHLDIPSQEALQEVLGQFPGTVVFVSHDRYLIDALATEIWAIEAGSLHRILGKWEKYLQWRSRLPAGVEAARAGPARADRREKGRRAEAKTARRQVQRMQRRQEKLEDEIHRLEGELAKLTQEISQASVDDRLAEVRELGRRYGQAESRLKRLWGEWTELTQALEVRSDT